MPKELSYKQLKNNCDSRQFDFKTIKELQNTTEVIGQPRALKAIDFGLRIKEKGFNIFVSGVQGTGRTKFAKALAIDIAKTQSIPPDLCYVYNFKEPKNPKKLILPAGFARMFKDEMDQLINYLLDDLPRAFNSKEYNVKKSEIIRKYQDKRDDIMREITKAAAEQDFGIKTTNTGMYFMPMVKGEVITEEQFEKLPEEHKSIINSNSQLMQSKVPEIMRNLKDCEKNMNKELEAIDYSIGLFEVGRYISVLFDKYNTHTDVINYLIDVKENILNSISDFSEHDDEDDEQQQIMLPMMNKKNSNTFNKYKVNVLVDNSTLTFAPVIVDFNPTYSNLCGEIEYENEFGNLTTDFTKIKAGLFHKANGGFLILQASDIFRNTLSWEAIRKVIKTEEIVIEPPRELNTGFAISSLKPEAFAADLKIIVIGNENYYHTLYQLDDDFSRMFKIFAEFDYESDYDNKSIELTLQFIKKFVIAKRTLDFDSTAVAKLIEYSSRLAESQKKMSLRFNNIAELMTEAIAWAKLNNANVVDEFHIDKAISEREYRLNMYEEKLNEMISNDLILIDTSGEVVGQINGLAVLDTGDYTFGKPSRITATTCVGKAGIVNIEKEADMSGNIHDKGVQVLSGYLGQTYAQDFPLSLSCRICFEQNYNGVDGDSASSTELYAILSSLSDLPLRQDIAVTGSINQRGEIQVIGGVTYKIEGFFDLCNKRGLTGSQGVIIPEKNANDLVLSERVIEAVKNGQFHIYPIKHVNEGIEILTGVKAGKRNAKGTFPHQTVHALVLKKLQRFYKSSLDIQK